MILHFCIEYLFCFSLYWLVFVSFSQNRKSRSIKSRFMFVS